MIDIGRVFSTSFAMFRQRFWLLVGMWAVFFALQMVASTVLGIVVAVMGFAGVAAFGAGLQDPAAVAGMGVGMMAFMALFYGAYVAILFAQQAAMVTLASPLERPSFGPALVRGFKSALPFFGIAVLIMLGYFAVLALMSVLIVISGLSGSAGGPMLAAAMILLFVPVMIYLGCRFAVVIPVVAVDEIYNPLTALRRAWSVTGGKVIGILLVLIGTGLLGILGLGAPIALIFASAIGSDGDPFATLGVGIVVVLLMIPLFILYTVYISAITAALHSEVTQGGADKLEEVFA
jgi:hypothetical protein